MTLSRVDWKETHYPLYFTFRILESMQLKPVCVGEFGGLAIVGFGDPFVHENPTRQDNGVVVSSRRIHCMDDSQPGSVRGTGYTGCAGPWRGLPSRGPPYPVGGLFRVGACLPNLTANIH